jgi:hypothetical protein
VAASMEYFVRVDMSHTQYLKSPGLPAINMVSKYQRVDGSPDFTIHTSSHKSALVPKGLPSLARSASPATPWSPS